MLPYYPPLPRGHKVANCCEVLYCECERTWLQDSFGMGTYLQQPQALPQIQDIQAFAVCESWAHGASRAARGATLRVARGCGLGLGRPGKAS